MAENFKSAVHILNKKTTKGYVSTYVKNPATHKGSEGPQTTHCQTLHPKPITTSFLGNYHQLTSLKESRPLGLSKESSN